MSGHSELPWRVGEVNTGDGNNIYSGDCRVAHTAIVAAVGRFGSRPVSPDEAQANAALIVAAVNAYPLFGQLVEALEATATGLRVLSLGESGEKYFPLINYIDTALSAAAAAKEGRS